MQPTLPKLVENLRRFYGSHCRLTNYGPAFHSTIRPLLLEGLDQVGSFFRLELYEKVEFSGVEV